MKKQLQLLQHNISSQMLLQIVLLSFVLSIGVFAQAQEVIDINYISRSAPTDKTPSRDSLTQNAIESASLDNIRLLIGSAKTERNLKIIREKIIPNSSRYILSLQNGAIARKGNSMTMPVDMKLSLKNLRAVLLEEGLLYQIEGSPKVLPIVHFEDRIGSRQYAWWVPTATKNTDDLVELSAKIENLLKARLATINFVGTTPQAAKLSTTVAPQYRMVNLQKSDSQSLGEQLKNQVVIRGDIAIRPKPSSDSLFLLDIKLEALHSANGRVIGDVSRTFETEAGPYRIVMARKLNEVAEKTIDELVTQIGDVWKSGSFGATLLKLTVLGNLNAKDMEQLKRTIPLQVRDVKSVKERLLEARVTTYEIDATGVPQQIAQGIKSAKWEPFKVSVKEILPDGLVIEANR
jgi:hypothetical protein